MNIYLLILLVIMLVGFSAICSGLNVAVMALDVSDLRRKAKLGDRKAKLVLPLRNNTHLTLASILITNIAAVSATSLVLNERLSGWLAGAVATLLIVVFGEVIPQAIFSNTPLRYTAQFSFMLKAMIYITYPFSKPLQLLLDKLFPRARAAIQTRHELGLMINEHLTDSRSELDDDEVVIMRGALQLSEKRVKEIMTPLRHTYWLTAEMNLDDAKIDEIKARGFSRIPVFDAQLTQCHGLLIMKSLVDVDFDDNSYKVQDLPLHPSPLIGSMTALDTLFRKFISSHTHLMPVEKDDKIIGVVTIEDLLEEIIGHEIEDESDALKHL
jgi:metal transporter CNNM